MAAIITCFFIAVGVFHQNMITVSGSKWSIYETIGFAFAAIVCVAMYHLLFRQPAVTDSTLA